MIQSKILGEAAGIQYQGVSDKSEANKSGNLTKGCLIGRFNRGLMGSPFTVTRENFKALLGYDPNNPDCMAIEDAFNRGVPSLQVVRVGAPLGKYKPLAMGVIVQLVVAAVTVVGILTIIFPILMALAAIGSKIA